MQRGNTYISKCKETQGPVHSLSVFSSKAPACNGLGVRTVCVSTVALHVFRWGLPEVARGACQRRLPFLMAPQRTGRILAAFGRKASQPHPRTTVNFTARQRAMGIHLSAKFAKMFSFHVYYPAISVCLLLTLRSFYNPIAKGFDLIVIS